MKFLREIINNVNIKDIFNAQFERLNTLFKDNEKYNKDYFNVLNDYLAEDFIEYILLYGDFDLRHPDVDNFNIGKFKTIIKNNYFNWMTTYKNQFETMINKLGTTQEMKTLHTDGYAGFDVDNQEGDFQKRKGNTNIDTTSNMTIIAFLQDLKGNLFDKIWSDIAEQMLVVIY